MHRQKNTGLRSWLVFVATTVVLSLIAWLGWSWTEGDITLPSATPSNLSMASVTVGLTDAPQSLDIRTDASGNVERALLGNVYETLVSRDDNNKIVAGLAKNWTVSSDGLTYDFTLNRGMRFANGHKLDSADVVWSMQQIVKNKYQGATALAGLASVANPSPTKVTLTLAKPNPTLLRALAGRAGIVYDSEWNGDYATQAAGSGPFTVGKFVKGQSVTLTANARYHGTAAGVGTATLRYYGDAAKLADAVKNGDVQLAFDSDKTFASTLGKDANVTVDSGMSTSKLVLAFNNSGDSILSDQQVRRALRHAIDTKTLAASQADSAGALGGPFTPLEPGYEDLTGTFPFDQAQARSMLSYFYSNYLGTIDLLVPNEYADLGNAIAEQLRAINFPVNVELADRATVSQRITDGKYTMAITTTAEDALTYAQDNVYHYLKGEVQQAYAKVMAATNDDDYQAQLKTYAKTLNDDAAADWLYTKKTFVAAGSKVAGYPKNLTDRYLPLAKVTVK